MRTIIIVATYIMLQAAELGVPATWCNFFVDTGLENLPDCFPTGAAFLIMSSGTPAAGVNPSPMQSKKKTLEAAVFRK